MDAADIEDIRRKYFTPYEVSHWFHQLVKILKVVIPLAAAAQAGRCRCRRAIPWERMGWNNPHCYDCGDGSAWTKRDASDDRRMAKLELSAEKICGLSAPVGWSR